ncbi:hypothetical protein QBC40DRAFT_261275 [Triangularia verruculosa]|uniref:Uncharacterized protein n=1 Tax=Triangularia verruculosa TaxID=2587418 RepID=A0AAN6XSM6_9PEZI|nr:hypothetical protein QBC40DRAFT_261275 [Triangularia verruculosa]
MLFPEEHESHFKKWIVQQIEKTQAADEVDADVLADYVLALLSSSDGDIETVRQACAASLPDFLGEGTKKFVDDIIEAITNKSYLPNAPPRPSQYFQPGPPRAMAGLSYDDDGNGSGMSYLQAQAPGYQPPPQQATGRKRAYNDLDNPDQNQAGMDAYNARAAKQPRRGRGGMVGGSRFQDQTQQPDSVPNWDPQFAANFMSNNMFPPGFLVPQQQQNNTGGGNRNAEMCRAYVRRGVCRRGLNCRYSHSTDNAGPAQVEEYDPANALMTNNMFPLQIPSLPSLELFGQGRFRQPPISHRSKGQGGNRGGRQRRGGGDRSVFSAEGPVNDRTKTTIVVESIPEENFDEHQVREFFSQFGDIVEITMYPYKRLAVVKFDCWEAANAAYKSPKVIFENRFVKVFWFKDEEQILPPPGSRGARNGSVSGQGEEGAVENVPLTEEQLEEIRRRQEEAQKVYEEKQKKREELEKKQEEIDKRQRELMAAKEALKAKLAKRGQSVADGSENGNGEGSSREPMTQSEALRAQLARLEEEARQIGIDPHADLDMAEDGSEAGWGPPRGGHCGRGRATWRGAYVPRARGYAPRGFRGGYRGRADVHAAYAAYSLDNRPKKVVVTGIGFTEGQRDEQLRQYLFGVGEFTHINHSSDPPRTEITFKDRKTAEKFFNSVTLNDYTIPEIEGQVELAWASSSSSSSTTLSTPTASGFSHVNGVATNNTSSTENGTAKNGDGGDGRNDDGESVEDDRYVEIVLDHQPPREQRDRDREREQNEMDYEVADDADAWY